MVSLTLDQIRYMVTQTDSTLEGLYTIGYENWFAIDALTGEMWVVPVKDILYSYESQTEDRLITVSNETFPIYIGHEYFGLGDCQSSQDVNTKKEC